MFSLMGNCMSWMKARRQPRRKVTLAILGLDNAGKTVTAKGLQGESFEDVAPTVGFSSVDYKFNKHDVTMFDLGGGKKIRGIWTSYFAEVYGLIYVIDSSDPERLDEARLTLRDVIEHPKITGKPILVLANKQDKEGALDELDITEQLRLEEMVNENKCPCRVEMCAAIIGKGKKLDKPIQQGMSWLLNAISTDHEKLDRRVEEDVAELKERKKKEMEEKRERVRKIREERERKQAEEDARLGIVRTEDSDDGDIGGDPFKRVDVEELKKKEAMLKEEKRKKKKANKKNADGDDDEDIFVTSKSKSKTPRATEEEGLTSSRRKKSNKSSSRERILQNYESEDEVMSTPKLDKNTSQQMRRVTSDYDDDNDSDDVTMGNPRRALTSSAPKPAPRLRRLGDLDSENGELPGRKPSPRLPPRTLDGAGEDMEMAPLSARRLAPLAPLGPLGEDDDGSEKKKKKKKKKLRKHRVAPNPDEEETGEAKEAESVGVLSNRNVMEGWNTPPGGRSLYTKPASRSPKLEPLEEPTNESSLSQKWGLLEELPEFSEDTSSVQRRNRPNSYDDDIVT